MADMGEKITKALSQIREKLGLKKIPYSVQRGPKTPVDKIAYEGSDLSAYFHESGLLMDGTTPVLIYIRDHSVGYFQLFLPEKLNKVHFGKCSTIEDMTKKGRKNRYQVTNRTDNKYIIELAKGRERTVKLNPCQNCLDMFRYEGFSYEYMRKSDKRKIINEFDAVNVSDYARGYFRDFTENLRADFERSGYPEYWRKIAYSYRRRKNFTCEKCQVYLHLSLTDCHHKDGVKSNCRDENLQCLCKECHVNLHPHYRALISKETIKIIQKIRKEQGLSPNDKYATG